MSPGTSFLWTTTHLKSHVCTPESRVQTHPVKRHRSEPTHTLDGCISPNPRLQGDTRCDGPRDFSTLREGHMWIAGKPLPHFSLHSHSGSKPLHVLISLNQASQFLGASGNHSLQPRQ